ncbi:hypothetical protein BU23DRAFT_206041 [Bimuria novae-zelandiae CBS 107.79]|uniref:DUF7728 domain-containing protein n=1 Tax=Bimuria novae-zelandiae CBS 107.79 TaxID=1447943 RepID=A0A6A5V0P1_9PLEO|nr:hypothetical protein BU23DRAFT_206041 [Bimuria novae-zelandiae CBS 107.79]
MMLSRTLNLALVAAGATNAILIPPGVSAAELDLGDDMAMEVAANSFPRTASLDCATCEIAAQTPDGSLAWTQGDGNSFVLDFDVGPHEDSLNIDGVQLYPPTFAYFTQPFRVAQINPDGENLPLRVTGYNFHYTSAETVSEAGIELIPMTFQINSIEGKAVDPPALTINLLKDPNGKLMIASFTSPQAVESSPADQEKECSEWPLLCKWRAVMADRINGMKAHKSKPGCHKHQGNPMAEDTVEGKPPHRFRPGHPHHRPHHMGGHPHYRHYRVHKMFRRVFLTVLVPILIGIFAGTLTYLIGIALGYIVAIILTKIRGQPLYESVALDEESDDFEEQLGEKEVYDHLPQYDSPPVYDEAVEKEVVEKEVAEEKEVVEDKK